MIGSIITIGAFLFNAFSIHMPCAFDVMLTNKANWSQLRTLAFMERGKAAPYDKDIAAIEIKAQGLIQNRREFGTLVLSDEKEMARILNGLSQIEIPGYENCMENRDFSLKSAIMVIDMLNQLSSRELIIFGGVLVRTLCEIRPFLSEENCRVVFDREFAAQIADLNNILPILNLIETYGLENAEPLVINLIINLRLGVDYWWGADAPGVIAGREERFKRIREMTAKLLTTDIRLSYPLARQLVKSLPIGEEGRKIDMLRGATPEMARLESEIAGLEQDHVTTQLGFTFAVIDHTTGQPRWYVTEADLEEQRNIAEQVQREFQERVSAAQERLTALHDDESFNASSALKGVWDQASLVGKVMKETYASTESETRERLAGFGMRYHGLRETLSEFVTTFGRDKAEAAAMIGKVRREVKEVILSSRSGRARIELFELDFYLERVGFGLFAQVCTDASEGHRMSSPIYLRVLSSMAESTAASGLTSDELKALAAQLSLSVEGKRRITKAGYRQISSLFEQCDLHIQDAIRGLQRQFNKPLRMIAGKRDIWEEAKGPWEAKPGRRYVSQSPLVRNFVHNIIGADPMNQLAFLNIALQTHCQDTAKSPTVIARGRGTCSGEAEGLIALTTESVNSFDRQGKPVILVQRVILPEDYEAMIISQGVLTQRGGVTSHAAILSLELNKPCVVGCEDIDIDLDRRKVAIGDHTFKEGDLIAINGATGEVMRPFSPSKARPCLTDMDFMGNQAIARAI